jgi:hypothetical protein
MKMEGLVLNCVTQKQDELVVVDCTDDRGYVHLYTQQHRRRASVNLNLEQVETLAKWLMACAEHADRRNFQAIANRGDNHE